MFLLSYVGDQSRKYTYTMTKCFSKTLREMNYRYVTYLIGPHITDRLSINCNTFDIVI